ncbi:MAG TPA: glycosyltransferase [Acidobacteriaceae bacterium]|jgi:GT2 family glycosyltransferase
MALPSVTVVIPTRNRLGSLLHCLQTLAPYAAVNPECSIIVSDDGDAVETAAGVCGRFPQVTVVQGPKKGPAANRNHGAAQGAGELIIFLDDDCIPEPTLIENYRSKASEHPETDVFEGRISAIGEMRGFADEAPANETGGHLWSCNLAIRRELFECVGGFDERFPFAAMEDMDFKLRVMKYSSPLFTPEAQVSHAYETRLGWKFTKHHALSLLLYLNLHGIDVKERSARHFFMSSARLFVNRARAHFKKRALKHPQQLLYQVWALFQVAWIASFWRSRGWMAKKMFPACCPNCRLLHRYIADDLYQAFPAPLVR